MTGSLGMFSGIIDRRGRRFSSISIMMVMLASCGPWTPGRSSRAAPAEPQWLSVTLDSGTTVTAIASLVAERDDWRELENVRGVGGQVLDHRDDTLLLRPTYLVLHATGVRGDIVVRREWNDPTSLPNILIVTTEPGIAVSRYRYPKPTSQRVEEAIVLYAIPVWVVVQLFPLFIRSVNGR